MNEKKFEVIFHHPQNGTVLKLRLPAATSFGEILEMLYQKGFLQKKAADYGFIYDNRLCALNQSLAGYIPPEKTEPAEIQLSGVLTIMC